MPNWFAFLACSLVCLPTASLHAGAFTNEIEYADGWFLEDGSMTTAGDPNRLRKITRAVGYTDNRGISWEVPKGNLTDGASIPWYVRWAIGGKFRREFERPSALHDHYVSFDHRVRPAKDTHRMFYFALLDENVDPAKAKLMYAAVVAFGASWKTLDVGEPCDLLDNCVRNEFADYLATDYFSGADFSDQRLATFKELELAVSEEMELADIEKLATQKRKDLALPMGDYTLN